MKKKFHKKTNPKEIVFAEQIIEEKKKIDLKEYAEYKEVFVKKGDWVVTLENGNQQIYDEAAFNLYFQPHKELLLD